MPIMFPDTGCEKCRNYWTHPFMEDRDKVMDLLQTNMKQQARLYKCNHCAAYWEEPNGAYPCGLTDEEVEKMYGVKNS